jgi:hypothetical protein
VIGCSTNFREFHHILCEIAGHGLPKSSARISREHVILHGIIRLPSTGIRRRNHRNYADRVTDNLQAILVNLRCKNFRRASGFSGSIHESSRRKLCVDSGFSGPSPRELPAGGSRLQHFESTQIFSYFVNSVMDRTQS